MKAILVAGAVLAIAVGLFALPPATRAQTVSDVNGFVRPDLPDQIRFRYRRHHRHGGHHHGRWWRGHGTHPHGGYDTAEFDCANTYYRLSHIVRWIARGGTITVMGSGPACTLSEPLIVSRDLTIVGAGETLIVGPIVGPCVRVGPGVNFEARRLRFGTFSRHGSACIEAQGAEVLLDNVTVDAQMTAVRVSGGRLDVLNSQLNSNEDRPDAALVLDGAAFTLDNANVRATGGNAVSIVPPQSGVASYAASKIEGRGVGRTGIRLHGEAGSGALIVLDRVHVSGFERGLVVESNVRAFGSDIRLVRNDMGADVRGSLTLLDSGIFRGRVGLRLANGGPRDWARIENNRIFGQWELGVLADAGAQGIVRDNRIGYGKDGCIEGPGESATIRNRLNDCTRRHGDED
jgi:hypothetical protein